MSYLFKLTFFSSLFSHSLFLQIPTSQRRGNGTAAGFEQLEKILSWKQWKPLFRAVGKTAGERLTIAVSSCFARLGTAVYTRARAVGNRHMLRVSSGWKPLFGRRCFERLAAPLFRAIDDRCVELFRAVGDRCTQAGGWKPHISSSAPAVG